LTVRVPFDRIAPEHCPRCEARHGVKAQVFLSDKPSRLLKMPPVTATGRGTPV
jgi:hypothetical protein